MPAKTPQECDGLFEKYVNEGDLDSLVDLYEPEATLVFAPGQLATGTAAIREALKPMLESKAKMKLNVTQTIIAGDVAVLYNEWSGTMTAGGQAVEMAGKAMEICHKQADGTWRFAIDDPFARGS
jgi:uncharacterized protein (TIGR02246 family)